MHAQTVFPALMVCGICEGGSGDDISYQACITSYDYDAPISEAGDYGQPGIGGPNKFEVRRTSPASVILRSPACTSPAYHKLICC